MTGTENKKMNLEMVSSLKEQPFSKETDAPAYEKCFDGAKSVGDLWIHQRSLKQPGRGTNLENLPVNDQKLSSNFN